MDNIVTADLSRFGYKELDEAADLLKVYAKNGSDFLNDGITLNFNMNSGYVFLTDEDYNVGMLTDSGTIGQWFTCPECGNEGFNLDENEYNFNENDGYCSKVCNDKNL